MSISPDRVRETADLLLRRLWAVTVPIYKINAAAILEAKQAGSGTLFRVAEHRFLVTAAHVYHSVGPEEGLYTTDFTQGAQIVPLNGKYFLDNQQDIAVLELSEQQLEMLPARDFLSIHDAERSLKQLEDGWYLVHGYPEMWTKVDPLSPSAISRPYTRITRLYQGRTNFENYDSQRHVLLDHQIDVSHAPSSLLTDTPERLQGISGCSIWQLIRDKDPAENWTPDDALVVAVETAVYRGGDIVRGTRWGFAHYVLHASFPELRRPLELVIPEAAPPGETRKGFVRISI